MAVVLFHSTTEKMFDQEPVCGKSPQDVQQLLLESTMDEGLKTLLVEMVNEFSLTLSMVNQLQKRSQKPKKFWIGSSEVCEILGISKRSLHTYRKKKLIYFEKIGGKMLYPADQIRKINLQRKKRKA
ncbi:hypothetical protein MASR2M12_13740 [Bacteroidales bacterium]